MKVIGADMWLTHGLKSKARKCKAFTEHINSVENKFTREDFKDNKLSILDCDVHFGVDRGIHVGPDRKPPHTDTYLL